MGRTVIEERLTWCCWMLVCLLASLLAALAFLDTPAWAVSIPAFYASAFFLWQTLLARARFARVRRERNWTNGFLERIEQTPEKSSPLRYEGRQLRQASRLPQPTSEEDWASIDEKWFDMISHMPDPEHREETQ